MPTRLLLDKTMEPGAHNEYCGDENDCVESFQPNEACDDVHAELVAIIDNKGL